MGESFVTKGIVYIVGAGPGDPRLITVYGVECIQKADVIAYDRLVNEELLAYAKRDAELIYCGKTPGNHCLRQEEINELLASKALLGKVVTRLKGGDPFVFGRGGEEAQCLRNYGIPYEIVPGITAGIAAPAYAGIPVTYRDMAATFTIVTAHGKKSEDLDDRKWEALANGSDTLAFYMGVSNLFHICERLIQFGKDEMTPVAVIQWGTYHHQKTVVGTLATISMIVEKNNVTNPAMIVIGNVVKLRDEIHWFENMNLQV